jgi:uncharacterized Zn-binding protein involved in type VI secretion
MSQEMTSIISSTTKLWAAPQHNASLHLNPMRPSLGGKILRKAPAFYKMTTPVFGVAKSYSETGCGPSVLRKVFSGSSKVTINPKMAISAQN